MNLMVQMQNILRIEPAVYSRKMTMYLIYYYKTNLVGIKRNNASMASYPLPPRKVGRIDFWL